MSRNYWPSDMQYPKNTTMAYLRCIGGIAISVKADTLRKLNQKNIVTNFNGRYIPIKDRTPKTIADILKNLDPIAYKRFCSVTNSVLKSRNEKPLNNITELLVKELKDA